MREPPTVHVLIVEDDEEDYLLTHHLLKEARTHRFEVMWADRLQSAQNYLIDASVDVILLDLTLPDSFGLDTFTAMRNHVPDVPIILLTGLQDGELGTRAVQAGAQDYLAKGDLSVELLSRSIDYAIERQRAQDALQSAHKDLESLINQRTRELAQATQQLHIERARRERAERTLREGRHLESICAFVESTAHRFGTLVKSIGEALRAGNHPQTGEPKVEGEYHELLAAAEDADRLSQRLVGLTRAVGVGGGRPESLSLTVVISEVLRENEEMLKRAGVLVKITESPAVPNVRADDGQIREILSSLLENSGPVLGGGGRLTLHLMECDVLPERPAGGGSEPECGYVILEALYGGVRMEPEIIDAILNPLAAMDGYRDCSELTGLGFALVESRLRGWGGSVEVVKSGEFGGGFRFYLPAAEIAKAIEEAPASALVGDRRIVIVDDDESLVGSALDALAKAGYRMAAGTSHDQGVGLLDEETALAVLLVDALLPDSGGARLLGEARRRYPDAVVIALSGFSRDILQGLLPLPAADWRYLQKPFDSAGIVRAVDDAVRAQFAVPPRGEGLEPRTSIRDATRSL